MTISVQMIPVTLHRVVSTPTTPLNVRMMTSVPSTQPALADLVKVSSTTVMTRIHVPQTSASTAEPHASIRTLLEMPVMMVMLVPWVILANSTP
jgi:hypothetical protein